VLFLGERLVQADIGLEARAWAVDDDTVELCVRTRAAARSVHLEAEGWFAEDEYFDLAPGAERRLRCTRWPGQPARSWRASVQAINAVRPAAAPLSSSSSSSVA
jgi:beta-mannosidase